MKLDDLTPEQRAQAEEQLGMSQPVDLLPAPVSDKPNKMDVKEEKVLQSQCEGLLNRRDIEYVHLSFRAREKIGWPDLTFALKVRDSTSYPVVVELKSAKGSLRKSQVEMLIRLKKDGWKVYVMRRYETFLDLINGHSPEEWEPKQK